MHRIILIGALALGSFGAASSAAVTVYILDNGVRTDHEVFEGIETQTVDFVGSLDPASPKGYAGQGGEDGAESRDPASPKGYAGQGGSREESAETGDPASPKGYAGQGGEQGSEPHRGDMTGPEGNRTTGSIDPPSLESGETGQGGEIPRRQKAMQDKVVDGNYGDHATLLAGLVVKRASDVELISVRTLDGDGKGKWSVFLKGVHWIINHHPPGQPAVANLSLGGAPEPRIEKLVTRAIDQLVADGVTVVVAAGNDGEDVSNRIPSTLESVISVGAVSLFNFRLIDSNFGSCVDVYAPGENLKGPGSKNRTTRIRDSGTSVASAVVTGRVAGYLAEHPRATPSQVKRWVLSNSEQGKVKNVEGGADTLLFRE